MIAICLQAVPAQAQVQDIEHAKALFKKRAYKDSFPMFWSLANKGNAEAQYYVGRVYQAGLGVPKDHKIAMEWYVKAANNGHRDAHHNIATMYIMGWGVPIDTAEAFRWYEKLANNGDADTQLLLGMTYSNLFGPKRTDPLIDVVRGYMWLSIVVARGNRRVITLKSRAEKRMSRDQINEATRQAVAWLADNPN